MTDNYIPEDDDFKGSNDSKNQQHDFGGDFDVDDLEIENEASKVSSTPTRNIVIIATLVLASVIFLYNMVFKDDEVEKEKKEVARIIESQPVEQAKPATQSNGEQEEDIGVVITPELQEIEGLQPLVSPDIFQDEIIEETEVVENKSKPRKIEPTSNRVSNKASPITPTTTPIAAPKQIAPVTTVPEPIIPQEKLLQPGEVIVNGPSAAEIAARKAARRKSGMMLTNAGGSPSGRVLDGDLSNDPFRNPIDVGYTSASQVLATAIGNTDFMIAQGKMIDAVLETAINTNLPGSLRAVISRDIYAETGKKILIPKGSRLIGSYDNSISSGQSRIVVSWDRVIRPDGIDIAISSPGTDQLGRAGVTGIVDNKYFEILSNAFLLSAITIGGTMALDGIRDSQDVNSSSTTSSDGSTTSSQTGTPTDFAILESAADLGDLAGDIASEALDDQITIYVHQGSRIKVFVNRDLIFPESATKSVLFVN